VTGNLTRSVALLALAVALASLPAGPAAAEDSRDMKDLVAVSRAMSAIDAAALQGRLPEERQERLQAAAAAPQDAARRFLALYATPRDEAGWDGFRGMLDSHPGSPWPHLGMARVYLEWRTWDRLDADLAQALAKAPDNWVALLLRAQAAERRERAGEARRDYEAVLRADPQNPEAHAGLARVLQSVGDAAGARREAQAALRVSPSHHSALATLGQLALAAGDRDGALAWLGKAVESHPRDRESRIALARLWREAGDDAMAAQQWRAAVGLREDAASLREVAELARRAKDPQGELRALERLVQVEPGVAQSWRRLAELRTASRDDAGAEQAWKKTLERDPGDGAARVQLALVYAGRGDSVSALRELRVAGEVGTAERVALEKRINLERIEKKDAQGVQRAVGALVDRTYRERLRAAPRLAGDLRLRVSVDGEGKATQVDVIEDTVHDDAVRACAYWNLRDASYPKNAPGRYTFGYTLRSGAQ
jgi:tetratricopeptide (TPR) repeat protein